MTKQGTTGPPYDAVELAYLEAGAFIGLSAEEIADQLPERSIESVQVQAHALNLSLRSNGDKVKINPNGTVYFRIPKGQYHIYGPIAQRVARAYGLRTISETMLKIMRLANERMDALQQCDK